MEDPAIVDDWSRAEVALYQTLMADPQLYESAVALIGVLATHLRATVSDGPGLLAAYRAGPTLVASVAPDMASWASPTRILAAACAIRYRELLAGEERQRVLDALLEAHAERETWVTIEAPVGSGPFPGASLAGATRVHVQSGLGMVCSVEMDLETGHPQWVTRPVRVDVATGAVVDPPPSLGEERISTSRAGQDEDLAALMALVEGQDHLL